MERQLVVFDLGEEHFAVNIVAVDSIIKMQEITNIPKSLAFVEGVINLRGVVLPVIDLRKRLGIVAKDVDNETRIIVVNMDSNRIGMIVDAVTEVLSIQEETIEPTPPMVSSVDTDFITGIAKVDDRLIIMLELGKVLSTDERKALKEI